MSENSTNPTNIQIQTVAQWITSLSISIICCAVLFVVFASYLVDLHDTANLSKVRIEVLQERQALLASELATLKHATVVQINGVATAPAQAPAAQAPAAAEVPAAEAPSVPAETLTPAAPVAEPAAPAAK